MNPNEILAFLAQQTGNAFNGAWNMANQAALPALRGASNILARPIGLGIGSAMGLSPQQMNEKYYGDISRGMISDKSPIVDAGSMLLPDFQGAAKGDPWAIASLVPYAGRVAPIAKATVKGVKEGQKIAKVAGAVKKAAKAPVKGAKPAKTVAGKIGGHVNRNAGKYYTGTIVGDLASSMYGGK